VRRTLAVSVRNFLVECYAGKFRFVEWNLLPVKRGGIKLKWHQNIQICDTCEN